MGIISGIEGGFDTGATVRNWSITQNDGLQAFTASNTRGGRRRIPGNEDWTGSYNAFGAVPAVFPGSTDVFKGTIEGTVGVTGTLFAESVEIVVDIEAGSPIEHTVNFGAHTALTKGAAIFVDALAVEPDTAVGCKLELALLAASPSFAEVVDCTQMTLGLTPDVLTYTSNTTPGIVKRILGNMDCSFNYRVYTDDYTTLPALGSVYEAKMFVNATEFYHIKYLRVASFSDLGADIEGGAFVGATVNMEFCSIADVPATPTPTLGAIIKPDTTDYWPF